MKKEYIQVECSVKDCIHFNTCCKTCTELCYLDENNKIDVLFVGQGAGKDEDITINPTNINRQPFYGKSGRYLRYMINYLWNKKSISANIGLSNTVRCHPKDKFGKNRDPDEYELNKCLPHLYRDILKLKPTILVLLGRSTSEALLPSLKGKSMGTIRGKIRELSLGSLKLKVMPTYHPSYLTRQFGEFKESDINSFNNSLTFSLTDISTAMKEKPDLVLF